MFTLKSDLVCYFDCDDTLVKWNYTQTEAEKFGILFDHFGSPTLLIPHKVHISQLKKHAARGHNIVVWSAGGWEWAQQVVIKLGLEPFVDAVLSKPRWAYDDLPASEFIPEHNRIYKKDE